MNNGTIPDTGFCGYNLISNQSLTPLAFLEPILIRGFIPERSELPRAFSGHLDPSDSHVEGGNLKKEAII